MGGRLNTISTKGLEEDRCLSMTSGSAYRPSRPESTRSGCVFDIPAKAQTLHELEQRSADPEFWSDPLEAQSTMRQISELRDLTDTWDTLDREVTETLGLIELSLAEEDQEGSELAAELAAETERLAERLEQLEFELVLSGEYDRGNAILAIHAGAGGTESQDWAEMLMRTYLRWAERRGYKVDILDLSPGEEAGVKSVTLEIKGPFAYGYLRSERGVHRLVRLSPFDSAHRRHTSFVLVEVLPEVDGRVDIEVSPDDIRMDVFRSGGAGGQNVQKNSTAVRLTHLPTGLVVTCQNERSQLQNRESALKVLKARLLEIELQKKEEERARLKGEHVEAGWGNQIRSYVLHPYNLVKDLRTGYETSNATAVLDGDLDSFIDAYLRQSVGNGNEGS